MQIEAEVVPGSWPRWVFVAATISISVGLGALVQLWLRWGHDPDHASLGLIVPIAAAILWPYLYTFEFGQRPSREVTLTVEEGLVSGPSLHVRSRDVVGAAATPSHVLLLQQRGFSAPHVLALGSAKDLGTVTRALGLPSSERQTRVHGQLHWWSLDDLTRDNGIVWLFLLCLPFLGLPVLFSAIARAILPHRRFWNPMDDAWLTIDAERVDFQMKVPAPVTSDADSVLGPETHVAHADLEEGKALFEHFPSTLLEPCVGRAIEELVVALAPPAEPAPAPLGTSKTARRKAERAARAAAKKAAAKAAEQPAERGAPFWTERGPHESNRAWLSRVDTAIDARRVGDGVFRVAALDTVALHERIEDEQVSVAERAVAARALARHEGTSADEALRPVLRVAPDEDALRALVHGEADEAEEILDRLERG